MSVSQPKFRFKKNDRIGVAAAEDDGDFLEKCFVDNGDIELLQEITDNRQILIGRTGAGKSAFLSHLASISPEKVITLSPDDLALTYVANSNVLSFFMALGVNLDPFYKLLWRHVLTVEILKRHLSLHGMPPKSTLFDTLGAMFTGTTSKAKEAREALDYLRTWGESFWLETEYRVKEITAKLEDELKGNLSVGVKAKLCNGKLSLDALERLSEEQKVEVVNRAQKVVSSAQVKDLEKVINLLDAVLSDKKKQYYIVLDRLDENWVEDRIRYKLIMALIVTARDFSRVKNAKAIIAMRRDLIDRVFRLARDSGFQEEKYQSLYISLTWTKDQLIEILDRRINALVRQRYTTQTVTHRDLLPRQIDKIDVSEYFTARASRPRDIITFFNTCIDVAQDATRLTVDQVRAAEGEYSRSRLRALADEWFADYPNLLDFARILQKKSRSFKLDVISREDIEELCLKVVVEVSHGSGILQLEAKQVAEAVMPACVFKYTLFRVFYRVGLVGLKLATYETESWADESGRSVSAAELNDSVSVIIHPAYYRALGVSTTE